MSNSQITIKCGRCNGTGIDDNKEESESCTSCEGDGYIGSGQLDTTDITEELEFIRGKLTAIWNAVKPPN